MKATIAVLCLSLLACSPCLADDMAPCQPQPDCSIVDDTVAAPDAGNVVGAQHMHRHMYHHKRTPAARRSDDNE